MSRKSYKKNRDTLVDSIALGFTTVLGITGVAAGTFIPEASITAAAIQAGAYCPAIVAAVVKRSAKDLKLSKKLEMQITNCAIITSKKYLAELKENAPSMYSVFRSIWDNEEIYNQNSTLDSIEESMKRVLAKEAKWEGFEITSKDVNEIVETYVNRFFIEASRYPELNQTILYGVSKKTGELEARQDILENKVNGMRFGTEKDIQSFYEYIYEEFAKTPKSNLYGKISLKDGYIEPMIYIDGKTQSVRKYLESWVGTESTITVISGEPGHGKTSLCWKAMCDFYKNDWLKDKVDNVFYFSLNPVKTEALNNNSFNIYKLLSWGDNRTNKDRLLDENDCKNALIFFDGFDELLEWRPGFSLIRFIEDEIVPFQEATGSHVVITTRNMAISPNCSILELTDETCVPINRLQLITKKQQLHWIKSLIKLSRKTSPEKTAALNEYYNNYKWIPEDSELEKMLGIPIIFRMIVEARYLPGDNQSIPHIYNDLFHITWVRHTKKDGIDDELTAKKKLQSYALNIFIDNNDTTEVELTENSSWMFSFYMTHEDEKRGGFLHRSFYQFFLANEILLWYREFSNKKDGELFENKLAYLARRRLDKTTLEYIKELYECSDDKIALKDAFDTAYSVLKETDGFLRLPKDEKAADLISSVRQVIRATNIFCNIVSIGSVCGQAVSSENINIEAVRTYDLSDCILSNGVSEGIHDDVIIVNAKIRKILINNVPLDLSGMRWSEIRRAGVDEAGKFLSDGLRKNYHDQIERVFADHNKEDLVGACFREADLSRACLRRAILCGADLSGVNLVDADLTDANLDYADLRGTDLSGTQLSGASLIRACMVSSSLRRADLRGADLKGVDLRKADLREANLSRTDLRRADLRKANLREADLSGADLSETDLSGADLSFANLQGIDFTGMILRGTVLYGTEIDNAFSEYLEDKDYIGCGHIC